MSIFKGLSAFPITPCDADGGLLVDDLKALVSRLEYADVQSVGLLGSTGSYAFLDRDVRRLATATARQVLVEKPLIVGVGALRTDDAIALAQDAANEGADGLLLAPVSYNPLMDDEVFAHYRTVAAATDLPLCIYNNPSTTHFTFTNDLLVRLAAVPHIEGVKMPLPADVADVVQLQALFPADFTVGYSADWGCADCLLAGGQAWFSAVAGYLPDEIARLARAAERGDQAEVGRMNAAFDPLWALLQSWGSLRVIHTAAQLEEVSDAVLPAPLQSLPRSVHAELKTALAAARAI